MTPDWTRVRAESPGTPKYAYDPARAEAAKANSAAARKKNREAALTGAGLPTGENPTTSEIDYGADELEFLKAVDRYKRERHRPHPTWREILKVLVSLGYRKVATNEGATDGPGSDGHARPAEAVG
jgi:hypothetical protein